MKSTILLATVLAFTGCGRKKIDASTKEQMEKSVETVRKSLPEKDREKFDESLTALAMSKMDFSNILGGKAGNIEAQIKESLDGKTGAEVIAAGQAIIEDQRAKARKEALAEIVELQQKKEAADHAKSELAKFKVTRSRFYERKDGFIAQPIIELSLVNQTTVSVSRAYFVGTLSSPGRAVPWVKDDFNYKVSGGIEPGETKDLKLAANMFSGWGKAETPADAVLTVEVTRIDGPDEKAAFDATAFSEFDAKRLEALAKTYGK